MRKTPSLLPTTIVIVFALLGLWSMALLGMTAWPDNPGVAAARVMEPTGLLVSYQDDSGRTVFYRELRAIPRTSGTVEPSDRDC